MLAEVGEQFMCWLRKWWQRRKELFCGEVNGFLVVSHPLLSLLSWTQQALKKYIYIYFLVVYYIFIFFCVSSCYDVLCMWWPSMYITFD